MELHFGRISRFLLLTFSFSLFNSETINRAPAISVDSNLIKNGDTKFSRSGQSIQFRCKGKTEGTIKWYKLRTVLQRVVSIPIPKSMTYKQGQDTLVLKIDQVVLANAGVYSCRQSYLGKIHNSKVMLNVSAPGTYKVFERKRDVFSI